MNDVEYEALEAQWMPLLRKFAAWPVPGMDADDIMQELRIILLRSQERYDTGKHTKFITFLFTSCLNKMLKLLRDSGHGSDPYMKYVPAHAVFPVCEGEHTALDGSCGNAWCTAPELQRFGYETEGLSDLDLVHLFGNVSDDAKWLIGLIARESVTTWDQDKDAAEFHHKKVTKRPWSRSKASRIMGANRVKRGLNELKVVLKGGLS
jgi:hypothetical protein